LRKKDTVATDEFIVRVSGHTLLDVEIGSYDVAYCAVRLPKPPVAPNTFLAEAISSGGFISSPGLA
jgi:hypothetical protein